MGVVAGVFRSIDPEGFWHWWLVPCVVVWLARWALWRDLVLQLERMPPPAAAALNTLARWDARNRALVLLQGALTGMACVWHEPVASGLHQSTLLIVVFTWVLGAMPSMLDRVHLFAWHGLLTAGPLVVAVAVDTADIHHLHLLGSLLLLLGLLAWMLQGHMALLGHLRQENERVRQLRLELAHQAAQEQAARVAAEVAHRAKADLMAATGHDLRQPLLALNLYALQLRARLCEPRDVDLVDGIDRSLHSLETLLGDLLDDARDEGCSAPALEWVKLGPVFERLAAQMQPCAFDRGLHLAWRGSHHQVWGDAVMVERVLRNLILNAIEHTDNGGVLVGARRRGARVLLQVWDSGCGMDAHQQAWVFDDRGRGQCTASAVRASGALPERGSLRRSHGLGLGIVRRLSHLMGADVRLRSQPGKGTVFEIAFPGPTASGGSGAPRAAG